MTDFFGPKGLFSGRLEGFEYRPQQERLAQAVLEILHSGRGALLAAEAPPGVGKTFAFLAPALAWTHEEGGSVLVLTSSITLQEQLISKDLPVLQKVLGFPFSFGLLKGRRNYACLRKAMELGAGGFLSFGDEGRASEIILTWLATTKDGDLSGLPLPAGHPGAEWISGSFRGCLGPRCPYREGCFIQKALRNAAKWQVVVANYHLFFAYALGHGGFPLGYRAVLCDEAHAMAQAASSVSTVTASRDDWARHLRRLPSPRLDLAGERAIGYNHEDQTARVRAMAKAAEVFFDSLDSIGPAEGVFTEVPESLRREGENILDMAASLSAAARRFREYIEDMGIPGGDPARDGAEYLAWNQTLGEMAESLKWCLQASDYPAWTYWREKGALVSAPSRCSDLVPRAFGGSGSPPMAAMSATMAVDRSFDYWSKETGLEPDRTLILSSPFDLARQMEIVVVDLGVPVTHVDYDSRVCRAVFKLCLENGGRTLILLASARLLKKVGNYLKKNARGYAVLVQGDLPKLKLLNRFREDETSVLVGTVSFREGVDVPGDSLTQVIVDRIPFPHPDDPVQTARRDLDGPEFFLGSVLPGAKMHLRQAAGRLIRSCSDSGKVVILDGRVLTKKSWHIPDSLPPVSIRRLRVVDRAVAPDDGV